MKTCSKCGIPKSLKEFYKDKQKKSGYRPDCKTCVDKTIKPLSKDKQAIVNMKHKTGLSEENYNLLLKHFNNKCGICGKTTIENRKRLAIDHDHATKIIRGLLCSSCNFGLGYFKDDIELLKKAAKYLKNNFSKKGLKHKERNEQNYRYRRPARSPILETNMGKAF